MKCCNILNTNVSVFDITIIRVNRFHMIRRWHIIPWVEFSINQHGKFNWHWHYLLLMSHKPFLEFLNSLTNCKIGRSLTFFNTTLRLSIILMVILLYLFSVECEQAHRSTHISIKYLATLRSIISSYSNIRLNSKMR